MRNIAFSEKHAEPWRQLARDGFGDDSIYDQSGFLWIIFRDPAGNSKNTVSVKAEGGNYTDVVVNFKA